jgi:signal transduction histidine kinase
VHDDKNKITSSGKSCLIVYGDNKERRIARAIWSLLAGQDVEIVNISALSELQSNAEQALLVLIFIKDKEDENCRLAEMLGQNPDVVADVIALTEDMSKKERLAIITRGFDATFNMDFLENQDFKKVLQNKIEKIRVRQENLTQEKEYRRFRGALDASADASIVFDEKRKIFFVSEHYRRAYPKSADKIVRGMDVEDAFHILSSEEMASESDPRYETMKNFWFALGDDQVEFTLNDGRTWNIKSSKLPDNQGTIVTTTDITKYRRQQKMLEKKSQELEEALAKERAAGALQKQFIDMVSHEFRTPLTIIDGNAQIIQKRGDTLDTKTLEQRAKTIRSAVARLIHLMEGFLSSNMLKTGKLQVVKSPANIKKIISEICEEYGELSRKAEIRFAMDKLPDYVLLDKKIITLVISNLISNALKFYKDEPVVTVTSFIEDDIFHLIVEDEGIGVPEDEKEKIFDQYYRSSISTGISGTGIGLNLVKNLLELHGGTITVENLKKGGARFIVKVPCENS